MYGQTEATARMAYLPPDLADTRPDAIGVPIPGGSFRLEPVPECAEPDTGELVYAGPNVMLGYAERPPTWPPERTVDRAAHRRPGAVLRRARTRSSDAATGTPSCSGCGSTSTGWSGSRPTSPARCVVVDEVLHAFTTRRRASTALHDQIASLCGLPASAVQVTVLAELPTTTQREARPGGARAAGTAGDRPDQARTGGRRRAAFGDPRGRPRRVRPRPGPAGRRRGQLVRQSRRRLAVLRRAGHPARAPARRAAARLAHPHDHRPGDVPRAAADGALPSTRRCCCVPSPSWRSSATHANVLTIVGGAHLLLAVAGYNFARFQLADVPRASRVRNGLVAVAQVVVPSTLFIGVVALATGFYDGRYRVLPQRTGRERRVDRPVAVLVPRGDRVDVARAWSRCSPSRPSTGSSGARRSPSRSACWPLALIVRFAWVGVEAGPTERYTVGVVAWCFALGWLAARARTLLPTDPGDCARSRRRRRASSASSSASCWCSPGSRRSRGSPPCGFPGRLAAVARGARECLAVRVPDPLAGLPAPGDGLPAAGDAGVVRGRDRLLAADAAGPALAREGASPSPWPSERPSAPPCAAVARGSGCH